MKNKGFTLIELLVTIVVLGIVSGIAIPVIRNIQYNQAEKRYKEYQDSVTLSAKLYTDSYSKDMFKYEKGCTYVYYKDMDKYNLIKDINTSNLSCNTEYTAVEVVKFREKYYYKTYIGCGTLNNNKVDPDIFRPEKFEESALCTQESDSTIAFKSEPESSDAITNKSFDPKVRIISKTGVKNSPKIEYGYSYSDTDIKIIDEDGNGGLNPVSFAIAKERTQLEMIRNMKEQRFLSKSSLITPKNASGKVYLIFKVSSLYNLDREPWKIVNEEKDKYIVVGGPYLIDNEPPKFNSYSLTSSSPEYNTLTPKLDLDVADNISSEEDLTMCISVGKECSDSDTFIKYSTNKTKTLGPLASRYNGDTFNIYVTVRDAAKNKSVINFSYTVPTFYILTYNDNNGSGCGGQSITRLKGESWGALCTPTRAGYPFLNWSSEGATITSSSIANSDVTVTANWGQFNAQLNKSVYVICTRDGKTSWIGSGKPGSCTGKFLYGAVNEPEGNWKITVSEHSVKFAGTNTVQDSDGHKYCFTVYTAENSTQVGYKCQDVKKGKKANLTISWG